MDRDDGDVPRPEALLHRFDRRREELPQCLGAAVEACGRAGSEQDATGLDRQPVALVAERAVGGPQRERHVPACRRAADGRDGKPEARRRTKRLREESCDGARRVVLPTEDDPRAARQLERASPGLDRERLGDDRGERGRPVSHARRRR